MKRSERLPVEKQTNSYSKLDQIFFKIQQVAGGTEHTGPGGESSTAFCQHRVVAKTTLLVIS